MAEDFNGLFNQWQDVCYPGLGRPYKLVNYVSDDLIIIADTRQGDAQLRISCNRVKADVDAHLLHQHYNRVMEETKRLKNSLETTTDAAKRNELNRKMNDLAKDGAEIRKKLDEEKQG